MSRPPTVPPPSRPLDAADPRALPDAGPIMVPHGESAARASDPLVELEYGRFHIYESNPVPWWMALVWLAFFAFAVAYLILNLLR